MNSFAVSDTIPFHIVCPLCRKDLKAGFDRCKNCGQVFQSGGSWIDLCASKDNVNDHTEAAYRIYSKYYAPVALLVYLIVWRGNILKHIRFFRELVERSQFVVDLATGDGSLTSLALFKSSKARAKKVLAIDISGNML